MKYLIIIPLIATVLFCLIKYFEKQFSRNEEQRESYALKYIFRDAILIFGVTLVSNFIYENIHSHLDTLFNIITETKTLPFTGNTEIFTDSPNF
jgi:lysylphosphatidylglycerol synthetase-like protein (DUF2156 family)